MNDEAQALLARIQGGDKVGAIKRMRELTGASLLEAKDAVERIHTIADAQKLLTGGSLRAQSAMGNPQAIDIEVRKLASGGQRIAAIKLLRKRNGLGLKEAKDALDRAVPPPPSRYGLPWALWAVVVGAMAAAFALIQT